MRNKKKIKFDPNKIIVVDVETAGLSARPQSFVFGCVYGNKLRKVFYDVVEMKNYLLSRSCRGKYIFAHNAEYDYSTIFGNVIKELDNECIFVGSLFLMAKKNDVRFFNSLAVLKSSVDHLGKCLNLPKLELDEKFKTESDPSKIEVTKQDVEYCFRDCEIVHIFLTRLYERTGKIKPSIASCAMEIFSSQYLQDKIFIHELNETFRASYYGGRVECFNIGKIKNGHKYDVNSLYPYVCTVMNFPDFENLKTDDETNLPFSKILKDYEGHANLVVNVPEKLRVGLLPYRNIKKNNTSYPVGTFNGVWNFNEIRAAQKHGLKIIKVNSFVFGKRVKFESLKNYMLDFFELKNTTTGAEQLMNKFLLNALTGKFGERSHTKKIYFEDIELFFANEFYKFVNKEHEFVFFNQDRNDFYLEIKEEKKTKSWLIPTVSSYITSEARSYMLQFYQRYAEDIIYTDTDSIFSTKKIDVSLIGNRLGQFKHEPEKISEIFGNKHYSVIDHDGQIKTYLKGVPKNNFHSGKKYTFRRMRKAKESIRTNSEAGEFIEVIKELKIGYEKRDVLKNGNTKPIKINIYV